jgi:hypothetical protein
LAKGRDTAATAGRMMGAASTTPNTTRMLGTAPFSPLSETAMVFLLFKGSNLKISN